LGLPANGWQTAWIWLAWLKRGRATGDDHDTRELRREAEPSGSLGDAAGAESLDQGLGDQLAGPGRWIFECSGGAHDATFPF
jgi:hypothetical protein